MLFSLVWEQCARRLLIFVVAIQLIDYLLGVCFIVSEDCEIIVFIRAYLLLLALLIQSIHSSHLIH